MLATELLDTKPFTIEYQGKTWDVCQEIIGRETIYLVKYPAGMVYLALVRANGLNEPKFWATIPENAKRHEEAQKIGQLIFKHHNSSKTITKT
jgi:hypothetical protein